MSFKVKITTEEIREIFKSKNMIILHEGDLEYSKKYKVRCLIDGHEWNPYVSNIVKNKSGCPKCSNKARYTPEMVDELLKEKNIKRLGEFNRAFDRIHFQCLVDGYVWPATVVAVLRRSGCPKCAGNAHLNKDIINERLKSRKIEMMDEYMGSHVKSNFKCLVDGFEWEAMPYNILQGKGCRKCINKISIDDEEIDKRLMEKNINIKRISSFVNGKINLKWECLKDGEQFECNYYSVLNEITGCPKCKNTTENKLYDSIKLNLNFDVLIRQKKLQFNNRKYYVDFYLEIEGKKVLIEYNGIQHYILTEFFGGEVGFKKLQRRDEELRSYCKGKDLLLIEIPYNIKENEWIEFIKDRLT